MSQHYVKRTCDNYFFTALSQTLLSYTQLRKLKDIFQYV